MGTVADSGGEDGPAASSRRASRLQAACQCADRLAPGPPAAQHRAVTDAIVLGADCGGTSTRVVAATVEGRVIGRGRAGAGNPLARPPADAAAELAAAASRALEVAEREPADVVGAVVGSAG